VDHKLKASTYCSVIRDGTLLGLGIERQETAGCTVALLCDFMIYNLFMWR